MDHNVCDSMFNSTNATTRYTQTGIDNVTREQYVRMCVNIRRAHGSDVSSIIIVPYALIFLLSVLGNGLVILTLVRHKKMRTITNMYLINLACSDLLLAVFCMPFTLIPMLMQEFVFGPVLCVLIRYAQAVSVGVSCGTLVAISLERFYAICEPLRSRRWQTLTHSYRVIQAIWLTSVAVMIPIAVFNRVIGLKNGKQACREIWPSYLWESLYMVLLDLVLLVIPLFLMAFSYGHVAKELWSGMTISNNDPGSPLSGTVKRLQSAIVRQTLCVSGAGDTSVRYSQTSAECDGQTNFVGGGGGGGGAQLLMHPAYSARVLKNKRRVVKMLCVVVLEYFVCWTPLFLLNSWTVLDYLSARLHFTPLLKSGILLLAYTSSCVHPITYCFMNRRFRQSFADAFRCCFRQGERATNGANTALYSEASQ
ncbi:hypothetical protein EGW08_012964, partial [Elysia chlorotica]